MMARRPLIFVLNDTCLEVVDRLREWTKSLPIDLRADRALGTMPVAQIDRIVDGADALVLPSSDRGGFPADAHMARHRLIKVMTIAASGYEWFDLDAATRHGIVVANAPAREGIEVVADQTFALMLSVARRIPHHHRKIREGSFERGIGTSVWSKTLGIVGLGAVGKAVARRARGFDMAVLATTRHADERFNRTWGVEVVPLEHLLRESDFVSLHVRLHDGAKGLIGARELALMKRCAFLINTARRELVDEPSLTGAVMSGRIAGVRQDDPPADPHSPLPELANFVCAPHLGNRAVEGMVAVLRLAIEQAVQVLGGQRPAHLLNPAVYDGSALRAPAGPKHPAKTWRP